MVTGPGFSSLNQPDQERTTAYRDSSGPKSRSDAHCVTIVGDCEEPSGESRLKAVAQKIRFAIDIDSAKAAGLKLSSKLLALTEKFARKAKIQVSQRLPNG